MGVYSSLEAAGIIKPTGSSGPVGNQLLCDGSAVLIASYPRLFAAIGTSFGNGDGSTTFNLPDSRGRFLRGQDLGAGNDPDTTSRFTIDGGNTGDNVGSYQGDIFQDHSHPYPATNSTIANGLSGVFTTNTINRFQNTGGGGGGSETRPKNVYVSYVITY